ncbi:MAG: hypothetical protein CSA84_04715 [Actinomycetales bacterium]|nr:MAG: hypothetical protein CSA84_04715 [Actinomycetales bacterium]
MTYAEQLRPLDAAYLALDGPTTTGHVCLYLPLEGPVTMRTLRRQIALGVRRMPSLRRRLQHVAPVIDLVDRPWWVDDADFDLGNHVFEHQIPAPGGLSLLVEQVTEIAMTHLDRDHPLWEVHLLHDPTHATSAVMTKVHHVIADGFQMRRILDALLGPESVPGVSEREPDVVLRDAPHRAELLARSAVNNTLWGAGAAVSGARSVITSPGDTVRSVVTTPVDAVRSAVGKLVSAPQTPFNRSVSDRRAWAFGSFDIEASRPVRRRYGVTVNDILHATIAASLRDWLIGRDALPKGPLVALVPLSARQTEANHNGANRIDISLCEIPTQVTDSLARLQEAHEAMQRSKEHTWLDEHSLNTASRFFATALSTAAHTSETLHLMDLLPTPINLVISNVPMFDDVLFVGNRQVQAQHPLAPVFEGIGINITVHGYQGHLDVGIATCAELVPDADRLWQHMELEYDRLCGLG